MKDEMRGWVKAMNKGGLFGRRNRHDKEFIEADAAEEWALAAKAEFGLHVTNISSCKPDPPDCHAIFEGRNISIELTELVDNHLRYENVKANEAGKEPPHYQGQAFLDAQWSKDRFFKEISDLIDKKTANYEAGNQVFDVLIVYTDEPWLSPQQVRTWLTETNIEPRRAFHSAYLLMTHEHANADHWPIFRLFGSLPPKTQE